jgi:DNA-binding CsgD family transcriptional regulator
MGHGTGQGGYMTPTDPDGARQLATLTEKQREVLDLLLEHKTSKEIARVLRISPHTVDQRIQFAKDKLGVASRNEVAAAYRRLRQIYGQMTYGDLRIARYDSAPHDDPRPDDRPAGAQGSGAGRSTVQGWFDGRHGTLLRLAAIVGIALLLMLLVLGGLALASNLSELMRN